MTSTKNKTQKGTERLGKGLTSKTAPLGTISVESFESQIQYEKTDVTAFLLPLSDVPLTMAPKTDPLWRTYDVVWAMPGYDFQKGSGVQVTGAVLCDLGVTRVTIYNESPETILLRMQRPMGYRDSPSSLAMWEPVRKNEAVIPLKPKLTTSFQINNGSTSHMVPRQSTFNGCSVVDLVSFCASREPLSDAGTDLSKPAADSIGLQVEIQVSYKTSDGTDGAQLDRFAVQVYSGDAIMDLVNCGPPQVVRVADLRTGDQFVNALRSYSSGDICLLQFIDIKGGKTSKTAAGLDTNTIYAWPYMIKNSNNNSSFMTVTAYNNEQRYHKDGNGQWLLGCVDIKNKDKTEAPVFKFVPYKGDGAVESILPPNAVLRPMATVSNVVKLTSGGGPHIHMLGATRAVSNRRCKGPQAYMAATRISSAHYVDIYGEELATHILKALTTIHKLVKVGLEIAGLVGLLAVPLPRNGKSVRVLPACRSRKDTDDEYDRVDDVIVATGRR